MRYLNTEEGFAFLHKHGWIELQLKEWMESGMLRFVDEFDKRMHEYLDSSSNDSSKYYYKYISFHAETNQPFSQSPIYINSLLRLPWNILFTVFTSKGRSTLCSPQWKRN